MNATWLNGLVALLVTAAAAPVAAMAGDSVLPQRVLYVGTADGERAAEFSEFLGRHFADVQVAGRDGFDPASAGDDDVVLLDWSQSESTPREAVSPFGELESWQKPTVLLGSAGLLVAACWEVVGGAG